VRPAGVTESVAKQIVALDSVGHFTCNFHLAPGTYDMTAKASHWLRRKIGTVTITPAGVSGLQFSLINGDVDGDNAVDAEDLAALNAASGSMQGSRNWNPNADLNGDGLVSRKDLTILVAHFGEQGDP
jgi:hypothetical protein